MKSTFKVLFYLKKGSEKKNGEVMIMARITIDGKLCQFSTKQSIQPDNWNTVAGKAKGRDAGRINALLDDIRSSWLSLKTWGIALKFLFLHHENILFPND